MAFPEFGPFEPTVHDPDLPVPAYMVFLGLPAREESQVAINLVQRALDAGESQRWIDALLAERNWRPHLPAAIGHLLSGGNALTKASLWQAIDSGSWVTPQLVVAALFTDAAFCKRVTERLDAVAASGVSSVRAPSSAKVVASLLASALLVPGLSDRSTRWQEAPPVKRLVEEDLSWDRSGEIVRSWKVAAETAFLVRGIALAPACAPSV